MVPLLLVVVLGSAAAAVAWYLQGQTKPEPESAPSWTVPPFVNRADFDRPDAQWLVVVFTSSTCLACQDTWEKAQPLESDAVAVQRVDSIAEVAIHDRYGIDAVPLVLVVDEVGSVRRHFLGPPSTSDLWATLAELREG